MKTNYDYLPHELEHLNYLKDNAYECALFLKRDDDSFPLEKPCKIVLIGNGVRYTVMGGTGSGAVNARYSENVEEAFENAGFEITSKDWLNSYDKVRLENEKNFIKKVKKEAADHRTIAASYSMGKSAPERDYEFPIIGDHKVAIYVLSRTAGEGSDRYLEKGSVYFTDTEIRDILYLNNNYEKFMLVLNVPGIVDLEPVMEVKNILLLSQLGSLNGHIITDIVLGKSNPSGKLTDTWALIKDYPYISTPLSQDECRYNEGTYVGYRYFSSMNISPLFNFGFGLSYSIFKHQFVSVSNQGDKVEVKVKVTNVNGLPGKEVIQLYMSGPISRPAIELVAFKKSKLLGVKESEELTLEFSLRDFPIYDEEKESYLLEKGNYLFKLGNSSKDLTDVFAISLKEDIITKKVKNVFAKADFKDLVIVRKENSINSKLPVIEIDSSMIETQNIVYNNTYDIDVPEYIKGLTDLELIHMVLGDYKLGFQGLIGQSCSLLLGGAGETTLRVESLDKALNMVDGPAGLRITREYILNKNGAFITSTDSIWEGLKNYLPKPIDYFVSYERNLKKKGSTVVQIATAIPIATALAQSFNEEFICGCGRLVKEEMQLYGADIWLAPGINIHRHILCGRNFEYYSEDPLISAFAASCIIKSVQEDPTKATTIKHFACNNQETNRLNNNSIVSEKAMREIYLLAFEKAIKWSNPLSIMTSYNLVNGIHSAEHHGLIIDILRDEWNYKGLVMTDWVTSGQSYCKSNKYPNAYASRDIKNGNNICMPGGKSDIKDIKAALKSGYLSRHELEVAATVVYNLINRLKP